MKRPEVSSERAAGAGTHHDEVFVKKYPSLNAYLTDEKWEDGKARELSALSFTVKDGLWQVALNDKALKASLYSSGESMAECLRLIEKAVAEGSGAWRPWKRGK